MKPKRTSHTMPHGSKTEKQEQLSWYSIPEKARNVQNKRFAN